MLMVVAIGFTCTSVLYLEWDNECLGRPVLYQWWQHLGNLGQRELERASGWLDLVLRLQITDMKKKNSQTNSAAFFWQAHSLVIPWVAEANFENRILSWEETCGTQTSTHRYIHALLRNLRACLHAQSKIYFPSTNYQQQESRAAAQLHNYYNTHFKEKPEKMHWNSVQGLVNEAKILLK